MDQAPSWTAVFAALADPTRRWLLIRLRHDGARSATDLARDLPMSRQAVVHHLQVLDAAGVVDSRRSGREVRWSATTAVLADATAWMRADHGGSSPRGRRMPRSSAHCLASWASAIDSSAARRRTASARSPWPWAVSTLSDRYDRPPMGMGSQKLTSR